MYAVAHFKTTLTKFITEKWLKKKCQENKLNFGALWGQASSKYFRISVLFLNFKVKPFLLQELLAFFRGTFIT